MVSRERAEQAKEEAIHRYKNMDEFDTACLTRYGGDHAVLIYLKYKTDYPFPYKISEVMVVKQIIGEAESYV